MQLVALLPLFALAAPEGSTLHQERVAIVTRHGIRVPFPPVLGEPATVFTRDAKREWFSDPRVWGAVETAALTDHGKEVIRRMGAWMAEFVLPAQPYNFTVYADLDATRRDIQTAEAFMRGALPAANFTVDPWDLAHPEYMKWLMNQGNSSTPACPVSGDMEEVVKAETGGDFAALSEEQQSAIMAVNSALDCCADTACPKATPAGSCTLMDIPTTWEGRKQYWEDIGGPLSVAAKLVEYLQLLYLNGMDWTRLAPSLTERDIATLMRLHEESMGIADDAWNAQTAGSEMLAHIAATFQQRVSALTAPSSAPIKGLRSHPSDRLVYYAAHDINIYLLRRLLRLEWKTASMNPNESPPGGFLEFDLASAGEPKEFFVKAFFVSQTYAQMREARPLTAADPASRVFAVIPGCAGGPELSCPFEEFKALVLREIKAECVQLTDLSVLKPRVAEVVV